MPNNRANIVFIPLLLKASLGDGQGSVKGAHWVDLCVRPGIYTPLTDAWSYHNFAVKARDWFPG